MNFTLTEDQDSRAKVWELDHDCTIVNHGAIGGATTYRFTPTSIGVSEVVSCACGKEKNLTAYDLW